MTPEEAVRAFTYIWRYAFQEHPEDLELGHKISSKSLSRVDAYITTNTSRLESMIRVLLEEKGLAKHLDLLNNSNNRECRTLLFRTYKVPLEAPIDMTVIQAVRATCAMPGWFTPVKIGKKTQERQYIACQNTLMNPVKVGLKEGNDLFGPDRRVACILSLGAGEAGPVPASLQSDVSLPYQLLPSTTSACRLVDEDVYNLIGYTSVYHRFSVARGLESLERFSRNVFGDIYAHTQIYLSQNRVERDMTNAVGVAEAGTYSTIGSMCKLRISHRSIEPNEDI
ncbi:3836_t:CDS:2 [Acaulospora colombiana]|uniref:3836_t:CDS:1 n=1 Tax=Acaulospora colombiana TaxID=27376 RepID=A0ACA9L630_9GLOM|nr:3836_t:CDS:2 [Acaulospora colombiana]